MQQGARISAAIEVLATLNDALAADAGGFAPADVLIQRYFRDRRYMGSKDRREVARLVYGVIRDGGGLEWRLEHANMPSKPRNMMLLFLAAVEGLSRAEIEALCDGEGHSPKKLDIKEQMLIDGAENASLETDEMPDWARYNLPEFAAESFKAQYAGGFPNLMAKLKEEAPVDLRINPLKTSREDVVFELDKAGYRAAPTPYSPLGVRLQQRIPLQATEIYKNGLVEVMDEGSQIVAALADAKPGDVVIDFCAGAGGKTVAIAEAMNGEGSVYAWDIDGERLKQMVPRLKRAGVHNVVMRAIAGERDAALKPYRNSADVVLVDAPCSGSGVWRRAPDSRWRYEAEDIEKFAAQQLSILQAASQCVKVGGRLIYATCSLYSAENDAIVQTFHVDNPAFNVAELSPLWEKFESYVDGVGNGLRALPHQHQTDGFFAMVFEKTE